MIFLHLAHACQHPSLDTILHFRVFITVITSAKWDKPETEHLHVRELGPDPD